MTVHPDEVAIRRATGDDEPAVQSLVGSVMGWGDGPAAARMWRWKHHQNASGPSPTWLACGAGGRLLGVRTFLRWRFRLDGAERLAVRAVDTVTHPDARGHGLFRRLTLHGLRELEAEGVDFVFNTPNDQSRPGYLSMGWQPVRQLTVAVQPSGPRGGYRMATNRVPAALESAALTLGRPATDAFDDDVCAALADGQRIGLVTERDPSHLRWRYAGLPELGYRVLTLGVDPTEGVAVIRARLRGAARELTVAELHAPTRRTATRLVRLAIRGSGADFALSLPGADGRAGGVPVPRLGPLLVARRVASSPPAAGCWRLSLGDVELF